MGPVDEVSDSHQPASIDRSLAQGIVIYRWLALAWATAGMIVWRSFLDAPLEAFGLLGIAGLFTLATTFLVRESPAASLSWPMIVTEVAIGASLLAADGWVHDTTGDPRPQSLAWAWPAAAIIATAVRFGRRAGLLVAAILSVASWVGESQIHEADRVTVAIASRTGLYVLAAVAAGGAAHRIREAEREISTVRAREALARDMHDGVLQTLAVIQRRAVDPELSDLARDQERDLRDYLFGAGSTPTSLPVALREAATMVDRRFGGRTEVVAIDDLPELDADRTTALVGAATEAMTNAAKHANAGRVVVFVEPTDDDAGVFCSIKDDGDGFDQTETHSGQGLAGSIEGRMAQVGGTVEIDSRAQHGTEVRLWVHSNR